MSCKDMDWSDERICDKCGGDVHEHFGDENYDGDYWTTAHCYKCGETFSTSEGGDYYKLKTKAIK